MKIGEFSNWWDCLFLHYDIMRIKGSFTSSGRTAFRNYHAEDVGFVQFIKRLKDMGMPLANIKRYADLRYAGSHTVHERMTLLQDHYRFIEAEIQTIGRL